MKKQKGKARNSVPDQDKLVDSIAFWVEEEETFQELKPNG
jgi:hypothetical protein